MLRNSPLPQLWFGFVQTVTGKNVSPVPLKPVEQPEAEPESNADLRGRDLVLEKQARDLLTNLGLHEGSMKVQVFWNTKLRSTAGYARWPNWRIELNPRLVGFPGEVERTLLHELAHLIAYARAGRRRIEAHGKEWQLACVDVGIPNESARHTLPLPRSPQERKLIYQCPNCLTTVERVRKFQRHSACLTCCRKFNGGRYDGRFQLMLIDSKD